MKILSFAALFLLAGVTYAGNPDLNKRIVPKYLQGVGIDQNLNAQVPLETSFKDESGQTVKFGDYLHQRPAVLALVYYTCPMLCDQILRGVARGLRPLSLVPGRDFDIVAISINPAEGPQQAAAKRQEFAKLYSRSGSTSGMHFLTGSETNIRAVADAVGFHYRYDPKSKMFFHAAAIMVLTPEGKAARYFYGVEFEPKDLKLGLIEASHNRIGSVVDQILLYCCRYDPTTGKYTATVLGLMRAAAAVFLLIWVGALLFFWRGELPFRHKTAGEAQRT